MEKSSDFDVPTIVNVYGTTAYEFLDNFLKVTIPFDEEVMAMIGNGVTENVIENVTENVTETQIKIIELIIKDNTISTFEMAQAIGVTRMTISRSINKLNEKGMLKRVGGDKGGHLEVAD